MKTAANIVDDKGTTQTEAKKLLENFYRHGFENDLNKAALALGRPRKELEEFLSGNEEIDDDLIMKVRGIARERNIEIE
jgi:plasmid maintenance system antidote protein VapI